MSATLTQKYNALTQENNILREQVAQLKNQLNWFKRQLFGEKSEKCTPMDEGRQADLFEGLNLDPVPAEPVPTETITYERRKKQRDNAVNDTGLRFDDSVPIKTIELPNPELDDLPADQQQLITEKVTYRLAQRPGSYVVLKYVRKVIKREDTQAIVTAPAPLNVLDKSVADVSFLVGMLVDKFLYHLPLYRQHQRLLQSGITLSRSTLTNLVERTIDLLTPIVDAQLQHILLSRILAMDETPIKAGRKQKGKMRQAYFWPLYGERDEVSFTYSSTRAHQHVVDILGEDFSGTLLSDGYEAYARYAELRDKVIHAACWSHTRRYFERAKDAEPQAAEEALAIIATLYRHEKTIRKEELTGQAKLNYRTEHSVPVVKAFWEWCDRQCHRYTLTPKNPLSKALKYAMARVASLQVFLENPDVPIDTNHLERALRPIPMGRRNWLFCWSELGAKHVAIIQSLLVTCKLQGVDPYTYLVDVLQRISQHPASKVLELTPRVWKETFAEHPLTSDLAGVGR